MMFNEKLDFLMNITRTTNSTLALYTSLDASHISRLRRGERKLPKNENYVKTMAVYFSRHCDEEYQRKAFMEALNTPAAIMDDQEKIAELLSRWLLNEGRGETTVLVDFLEGLSRFQFPKIQALNDKNGIVGACINEEPLSVYYGISGKQQGVLTFLSGVLNTEEPQTLLLYSDEDMDWLTGDRAFTATWADMMTQVVRKGNRIRIIHTISRHLDEMLSAIAEWMPLYMTGAIEPYYYPKKRDGIFKRTLFIAPKTAAVASSSVGMMEEREVIFFLKETKVIDALCEEFNNYFMLCRPLMRFFTPTDKLEYMKTLVEFEQEKSDAIIKTETLSLATMPEVVMKSIITRLGIEQKDDLVNYLRTREQVFVKNLADNQFVEIIRRPDISSIKEGKVRVGLSNLFQLEDQYYNLDEYRLHLENMALLMKEYNNYNVYIEDVYYEDGFMIYAKEDLGVIVVKTSKPSAIFAINESNMRAAFWDYLKNKIDERRLNKKKTLNELHKIIDDLNEKCASS